MTKDEVVQAALTLDAAGREELLRGLLSSFGDAELDTLSKAPKDAAWLINVERRLAEAERSTLDPGR